MTLSEAKEILRRYEGTDLYEGMETFLLSLVPENPDTRIEFLKMKRDEVMEDLKDLEFTYGGEDHE